MTQPTNSQQTDAGRLYTWPPTGETFTSVTTILNVLNKPFLGKWKAKQAAEYAIGHWFDAEFIERVVTDPTGVIDEIAKASDRTADGASDIGNDVHAWVECYIKGETWDGPEPPHAAFFKAWEAVYKPKYVMCESTVYNRSEGYAGTMDIMAVVEEQNTIIDVKTGKAIYPEVALQLCAYKNGEFVGVDNKEFAVPMVTAGAALHLRPRSYKYIPVRVDNEVWQSFRYIKEAYRWQQYTSKTVLNSSTPMTDWEPERIKP